MTPDVQGEQRNLDVGLAGGLAWTAGAKWATQVVTWGSTFALVRILDPTEFGVAKIAGIFLGITNVLAEFGVGTAVLHMPELNRRTLAQLNLFSLLLCSLICSLSVAASPLLAGFFRSDHVLFFAVSSSAFLITGIQAVPAGLLQRDMDYRRLAMVDALMACVQATASIATALLGGGFWALFVGPMAGRMAAAALTCYWKPMRLAWPRWEDIRKPVEMGRHVATSRITSTVCGMADSIVVGRFLGEAALGGYGVATDLASAPAEKVSALVMRAAAPLFANVMDNQSLVRRYYLIITELLSLCVLPLMLGLVIVAPGAVPLVLGPQWTSAFPLVQWLGLFMTVRVLGVLAEQVLVSQRLTRFTMRMSVVNIAVMVIAFVVAARWYGAVGVAASWFILSPITIFPLLGVLLYSIRLPLREYAWALLPAAAGSGVMCGVLLLLDHRFSAAAMSPRARLCMQVAVGAAVYGGFLLLFFRQRVLRYQNFLTSLRKGKEIPEPAAL